MTAHALMYVDRPAFYRFVANADDRHRYEWVRGWIMERQAGGARRHGRVGAGFIRVLGECLDLGTWAVSTADRLIHMPATTRYADALVERIDTATDDSIQTDQPVLLVEVLSPSSEERDLSVKSSEYLALASLNTYIVASQDAVLCYVWQRRPDGTSADEPAKVAGRDAVIQVPGLSIAIPLGDVDEGIGIA